MGRYSPDCRRSVVDRLPERCSVVVVGGDPAREELGAIHMELGVRNIPYRLRMGLNIITIEPVAIRLLRLLDQEWLFKYNIITIEPLDI
jgi:hypothetical protein